MARKTSDAPDRSITDVVRDPLLALPTRVNPRTITPQQRARLKRLLTTFGNAGGIVLWRNEDGAEELVGGNQRHTIIRELLDDPELEAPRLAELGLIPMSCKLYGVGWTRAEMTALGVGINNREAQGDWDLRELAGVMAELGEVPSFDATVAGFDQPVLEAMLTGFAPAPTPNSVVPGTSSVVPAAAGAIAAPVDPTAMPLAAPVAPTAHAQAEPVIRSEVLVEIRCTKGALALIQGTLAEWSEMTGVEVSIT